jgi:hypothetical protein
MTELEEGIIVEDGGKHEKTKILNKKGENDE